MSTPTVDTPVTSVEEKTPSLETSFQTVFLCTSPYLQPSLYKKARCFYGDPAMPTVLVGKQKHKLPILFLNLESDYRNRLIDANCYKAEAILEEVDIVLDDLFLITWAVLNLSIADEEELGIDRTDIKGVNFDQPLILLDFLRPCDQWKTAKLFLSWYSYVRPIERAVERLAFEPCARWYLEEPETENYYFTDSKRFLLYTKEKDTGILGCKSDGSVSTNLLKEFKKLIGHGWKLYVVLFENVSTASLIYTINCLKEIYSTTSQRSVTEILNDDDI